MSTPLAESYARCQQMARRAASNFYYCFYLLPWEKRRSMCALYAYLRRVDDLGDSHKPIEERRSALDRWRLQLERALGQKADDPILPALVDTVNRYHISPKYLTDVIDGVEMDLLGRTYETFADLEKYCYRVASVVGLSCIHIWGFRSSEACEPAKRCGLAFQLTNILRDLGEDAARGRIYLPREELGEFGYSAEQLQAGVRDDRFRRLMRFQIDRAEKFYSEGAALEQYLDPAGRRIFRAMVATYHRLLEEIRRRDGDVFSHRVRVSKARKLVIAVRAAVFQSKLVLQPAGTAAPRPVDGAKRR